MAHNLLIKVDQRCYTLTMKMHICFNLVGVVVVAFIAIEQVDCQCTFGSTFRNKVWRDNTKGTLTFTNTKMTGWAFKSIRSTGTSTISAWQCVNHTDSNYLVLRTQAKFTFQPISSTLTTQVYAYLCMKLTNITAYSFVYYQQHVQEINLGGARLKVSANASLYQNEVCDGTVSIPPPEYHVLVLSGNESNAAIQCPDSLLFIGDYAFYNNDGATDCTGSDDSSMDVCSNKTQPKIDYTKCSQKIAFSANGLFYCIASISYSGYDYTTLYNRDSTITGTTNRFACLSISGSYISVAAGNCTSFQNPFSFPLLADQVTQTGHRLIIQQKYTYCGTSESSSSSLSPGEIAAIVICILLLIFFWTTSIIITCVALVYVFKIFLVFLVEFTSIGDHVPRKKLPDQEMPDVVKNNLDVNKETLALFDSFRAPSSIHIELKEKADITKEQDLKGKHVHHHNASQEKEPTGKTPKEKLFKF